MPLLFFTLYYIFFFKQKTAYEMRISDWSSDVCSSDLRDAEPMAGYRQVATTQEGPTMVENLVSRKRCDRLNSPFELLRCSPPCRSTDRSYAGYCKRW